MNQTGVRSVGSSRAARTRRGRRSRLAVRGTDGRVRAAKRPFRSSRAVSRSAAAPPRRLMQRVGEHPVPAGPLAVRWLGYRLPELRAGRRRPSRSRSGTRARRRGAPAATSASSSPTTGSTTAATRSSGTARASTSASRSRRATRSRSSSASGRRSRRAATAWRSTSSRSCASGSPRSARRRSSSTPTSGRGSRSAASRRRPRRRRPGDGGRARRPGGAARRGRRCRDGVPGRRRDPGARLVAAHPRRARGGVRRRRRLDRGARPLAPGLGARRRPQPCLLAPAPAPSLLAGLEPGEHAGLPAHVPDGEPAIFDGRIRLRLPRGRRRG